ncbi:MAG: hypothetical protein Q8L60_13255 [Gammaproteobacteria bacterium]|nr:hypothetical protein [Gammaproteobacteria bacterium]MDP2140055.1 hypothetical protein [Gammaproteobacteria bacterium]MDP2347618.1 hypothetical protein [Gammaproteobacteria bacterium]
MRSTSALEEFKSVCQGYYSVYVVSNEGMSVLAKEWQMAEGFDPQEMFRIKNEDSGAIISEQPNFRMQMANRSRKTVNKQNDFAPPAPDAVTNKDNLPNRFTETLIGP